MNIKYCHIGAGGGYWINRSRSADFEQTRSALTYSRFSSSSPGLAAMASEGIRNV